MKKIISLIIILCFISCSKDNPNDSGSNPLEGITLTTKVPTNFNLNTALSGGASSSTLNQNYNYGVCYGPNANPSIDDNTSLAVGATMLNTSDFNTILTPVQIGQSYHLRAYVKYQNYVKYGNDITFTQPSPLTTDAVKNISTKSFDVSFSIATSITSTIDSRGVCYSTSANPTVNNAIIPAPTGGTGSVSIAFDENSPSFFSTINPNTTYYLRSYITVSGNNYYGNEVTFKTPGYIGGSGGYVFFDKGETTNGWRYLEVAPNIIYYNNTYSYVWGCSGTYIANLSSNTGTGLENTLAIKNACNFTNVAAYMANTTTINGKSDWFLPSINELKMLYNLKQDGLFAAYNSTDATFWSSTQATTIQAQSYNFYYGTIGNTDKGSLTVPPRVIPVRRF